MSRRKPPAVRQTLAMRAHPDEQTLAMRPPQVEQPAPRKMGRPVDPSARRERVLVRATPEQLAAWEAAAAEAGHSVGTWLWWIANRAAEQSR